MSSIIWFYANNDTKGWVPSWVINRFLGQSVLGWYDKLEAISAKRMKENNGASAGAPGPWSAQTSASSGKASAKDKKKSRWGRSKK